MYKNRRFAAVILAGGQGKRMASKHPKQYLDIHSKPMLYYAIQAFEESPVDEIIIVCDETHRRYCGKEIVKKYRFTKVKDVVNGGIERYNSSLNGLNAVTNAEFVLIHDGARPCLSQDVILRCMDSVITKGATTSAVPMVDTVCEVDENGKIVLVPDRNYLWSVQTPQAFLYKEILEAHTKLQDLLTTMSDDDKKCITDDIRVYQNMLCKESYVCEGAYENIKVTTFSDVNKVKTYISSHSKIL